MEGAGTKADDIALAIEEAIVAGELPPGSVLRQEQLFVEQMAKSARRTFSGPAVWAPGDETIDELYALNERQHRAIQAALATGSAEGARAIAREHVLSSFELLETILAQVGVQPDG